MKYTFKRLESGWNDSEFENKLKELSDKMAEEGWSYYDIKITSNGNNSLMIFSRDEV